MAKYRDRQKDFKHLGVSIFHEERTGIQLISLRHGYNITVWAKPSKLAKELRRVARWLERQ
jgi:hypothetical protein